MIEDDWLTLSALEHHAYCPWQARLLHDGVWADNHLTVQGTTAHERVDVPGVDSRRGVRVHRRVALASRRLRVHGIADAVEEHPDGALMPVEHKWGRGAGDLLPSIIQATAQALCLEEMLAVRVPHVAIYVVSQRRREVVSVDTWREGTELSIEQARRDLMGVELPRATYATRRCRRCSVLEACQPLREGSC